MIAKGFKVLIWVLVWLLGAVIAAMFATGEDTFLESDGDAVNVRLTSTVKNKQVAHIQGWTGITSNSGGSGDYVGLDVSPREYQFTVPASLTVNKGDIVYVDTTDLTGHTPDDTAYYTASGSNRIALFKATEAKDANNVVTGILRSKFS